MLLKFINNTIQKYLDSDPEFAASLKSFNEQNLLLKLTDINQEFLIGINDSTLIVSAFSDEDEAHINTTISANVITLIRLGLGTNYQSMLNSGVLQIEGDVELASQLRELFTKVDIDWEELASKYVGDSVAYQLGLITSRFKKYKQRSMENFRLDVSEYLQEESRLMPTKIEIERYLNNVDRLEADIDRLEARTRRLLQNNQ